MKAVRSDAAEKVIYDFAVSLFGYQDTTVTNPDNIQMSLITFNRNANVVLPGNGWTTNLNDITSRLSATGERGTSKLPNSSGTNYEAALRTTLNQLGTADGDQTFVIFVTDGAPSQVVGTPNNTFLNAEDCYAASQDEARNIYLYDTKTHSYVGTEETRNTTIFGVYAYGTEADFLDDVIYYALNGYARPGGETSATAPTDQYYNASSSEASVPGFIEMPAFLPYLWISSMTALGSCAASRWKVIMSAPISANSLIYLMGSTIIRCTSKTLSVALLMLFISGIPKDMDGTKLPSITSM